MLEGGWGRGRRRNFLPIHSRCPELNVAELSGRVDRPKLDPRQMEHLLNIGRVLSQEDVQHRETLIGATGSEMGGDTHGRHETLMGATQFAAN